MVLRYLIQSCLLAFLISSVGVAQTINSVPAGGAWNNTATWVGGVIPTNANSTVVVIVSGATVNIPSGFNASAVSVTITSATSTSLVIDNVASNPGSLSFSGTLTVGGGPPGRGLCTVNGILIANQGSTFAGSTNSRLTIGSTGVFRNNYTTTSGSIPVAIWSSGSTLEFAGYTSNSSPPSGLNQVFHNITWNCPNQAADIYLDASGLTTVNGNFRVLNTSFFVLGLATSTNSNLTIAGDLEVQSGSYFDLSNGAANSTINLGGDLTVNEDDGLGNFGFATCEIIFSGSTQQDYISTNNHFSDVDYIIKNGSTLNLGTSFLTGSGEFTLQSGGTLIIGSPDGLTIGSSLGNIRVSGTRNFNANGNILYNANLGQSLGNEWGSTGALNGVAVNLEIANTGSGVTNNIIGSTSLVGSLTLTTGSFNIGNSNTLQIQSNFNGNGGTIGGLSSSNLTFSGSGVFAGTLNFTSGAQALNNFTINRSGTIILGTNLTINGTLDFPSSGNLEFDSFNGQTLTINGNIDQSGSGSGGLISGSSFPSNLTINGTGTLSALPFCSICEANQLNNVILARTGSGAYTWDSSVTITGTLSLTSGILTNLSGLTMGNGSTIIRQGGSLVNDRPDVPSGSYNVTYSASVSTGFELPGPSDLTQLNNLTINGGTVLTQSVTVNGNVSLNSGTLNCGANTITMNGSNWSRAGGSFIPSTGQVTFNGVTTITTSGPTPQLGNIRVESAKTINLPSSSLAVSGNITLLAGSIINSNNGTLILNGTGLQSMGAGGATLNNITVTKSGGSVALTSALNVTGILNITTATTVASSGNLTLISTSDGTTGNASIADLSGGGSVTGNVTIQRFMAAESRVWRYLSSPIQNATVASWKDNFPITGSFTDPSTAGEWPVFSPALVSSSISMYRYNETTVGTRDLGWEAFPTTGLASANAIEVGRGYSAFVRNTASTVIDVTGPINSGDISLPVTLTGTGGANNDNGWSIVGNPYPSSIDWDSPNWTKTNISGVVQIRDDPSGIFQTWNGSIGSMGSGRIATGQGFWVQAVGAPTLTARESVKTNTTGAFYKQDNQVPDAFEIILSKGTDKDFAYLWFKDDATEAVDAAYDAAKFNNDIFDFSIVMANGDKLAINTIPYLTCGSELKLDLSTTNTEFDLNGSYSMEFGELGAIDPSLQLQLFDAFTNSTMDISDGATYSFDVTDDLASFGSERFKLTLLAGPASFEVGETTVNTSCKPGSVVISASGAPTDGLYRWYESEVTGVPLLESTSSQFTTPVLDKTKTYYVSVGNELGCESTRKAVQAEVINYDDVVITEVESELASSYAEGNQWFRDDILIPGAIAQNYKPEETGSYKVEVSIGSCKTSAERSVTITGLEDEAFFEGYVKIFPNPVSRELTIIVKQENSGSPRIIDLNGREMGKLEMNKENESWKGTFDFGGRAEGVYLLQVADKNGKIFNKRIVKK